MHLVHQLSIPIGAKSVSIAVWLSCRPPLACIVTAANARNASFLLSFPLCILLAILVAVAIFFFDCLQVSHLEIELAAWFVYFVAQVLSLVV
jgi:hypothetical protein